MKTIWKFPLPYADNPVVDMPLGSRVFAVGVQNGGIVVWAHVETANKRKARHKFFIVGTGQAMPERHVRHIGTVQIGALVRHVFESEFPPIAGGHFLMRMWSVPPHYMCRKHLLGEHVEMHMFAGSIAKGTSMRGYLDGGLLEIHKIRERHDVLAEEMLRRGYTHNSPIDIPDMEPEGAVDILLNVWELSVRCAECAERIRATLENST